MLLLDKWTAEGKTVIAPALFAYEVTNMLYRQSHCLTKIFLSSLQADMFPRLCSGLFSKTAASLICSGAGEGHGIR
jgi:hypothetical protein